MTTTVLLLFALSSAGSYHSFRPGQTWNDTEGNRIEAHAGGILYDRGTYYWYGQHMGGRTSLPEDATWERYRVDVIGISCYSSKDLYNWKYEGLALPAVKDDASHDLHTSRVVERPKVVYNEATGQYVMWMHIDSADYSFARAGVAVSDSPAGPYRYVGSIRPEGAMARDMTLFKDENGAAYLIYASENNATLYISKLTADYLKPSRQYARVFENQSREAPALFKHEDRYYLITSGCTGWDPNPAMVASAESIFGPWTVQGNPAVGPDSETTFDSQSTFVLPVAGQPGAFIFMADRWNKKNLGDSRYVWLPVEVTGGKISISWKDEWDLSTFQR